jgi:hypothetical protein
MRLHHRPIPQIDYYLQDGSPALICSCSDIQEYNMAGWMDHFNVVLLDLEVPID